MQVESRDWRNAYQTYSLWGATDPEAPVTAKGQVLIEANADAVWNILADVQRWKRLRPDIETVTGETPLRRGASYTLVSGGSEVHVTFGLVIPNREMNWTTHAPGLVMTCRYVLVALSGDQSLVVCQESLRAPDYPQFTDDVLSERVQVWLSAIKIAAEEAAVA